MAKNFVPFIPNNTPLIVGVLEATNDTVHHFPEIYVGTVRSKEGVTVDYSRVANELWWPITSAQVAGICSFLDLLRTPDLDAKVSVSGPMNSDEKSNVHFTHLGKGVYGDIDYKLALLGGGVYQLNVVMTNGIKYTSKTRIPALFELSIPDTVAIPLKLNRLLNGVYHEEEKRLASFDFTVGDSIGYVVKQHNSVNDHFDLYVPEGKLLFEDRSNFLRDGRGWGIFDASTFPNNRAVKIGWQQTGDYSLRPSEYLWISLKQLNHGLSNFFFSPFSWQGMEPDGPWEQRDEVQNRVYWNRDTTYAFLISNILKVSKSGDVLPKSQSDAIGVFGAYSAAYRNTTVIPIRSWDPDTLNWGFQQGVD